MLYRTLTKMLNLGVTEQRFPDNPGLRYQIAALPIPRSVSLLPLTKFFCLLAPTLLLGFAVSDAVPWLVVALRSKEYLRSIAGLFTVAAIAAFLTFIAKKGLQNRKLLMHGEFTIGRVTHRRVVDSGRRRSTYIRYVFVDSEGNLHTHSERDFTKKYEEGMAVGIFYDRQDPSRNVAICSTAWELSTPAGIRIYRSPSLTA